MLPADQVCFSGRRNRNIAEALVPRLVFTLSIHIESVSRGSRFRPGKILTDGRCPAAGAASVPVLSLYYDLKPLNKLSNLRI